MGESASGRIGEFALVGSEIGMRYFSEVNDSAQEVPREAQGIMTVSRVRLNAVNNIIAGHTRGVFELVGGEGTLVFDHTLWYANTTDADPSVTRTHDVYGDPAFEDAPGGNYRIGPTSAARDAGASAGVNIDFDGNPRDAQPDIGAYEYR